MANIYAVATGNWSNVNAWSDTTGGAPPASKVPGPGDTAILNLDSGVINVTVDAVTSVSQINGTIYTGTLTVANALSASAGLDGMAGNLVLDADFTISDTIAAITATVTGAGDLTCNGVFTIGAADFSGHTGTVICAGAASYTFTPGCTLGAVEFKKTAGTASLGAALTCAALTVTSGGFSNGGAGNPVDVAGNITFTASSGDMTAAWTCGGSLSIAAGFDLWQRAGSLTFDAAAGDPTITTNEVRLPAIIVDNAGVDSFVLQDILICDGFTLTDGKFDANGKDVTAYGNLIITAGTLAAIGSTWTQAATGNVINGTSGTRFGHIKLGMGAGVVSTMTGHVYAEEWTFGPGDVKGGAVTAFFTPSGNDQWHQSAASGEFSVKRFVMTLNCDYEVGYIDMSHADFALKGLVMMGQDAHRSPKLIGDWNLGTNPLNIFNLTDTKYARLNMDTHNLTCGAITVGGDVGNQGGGQLVCGTGRLKIASIAQMAGGDAAEDLVDFASSTILLSGTIDCTGIDTLQNTRAVVAGGEVRDTDLTGQTPLLHIYPSTAGTNNVNVTEIAALNFGMGLGLDMAA